MASGTKQRTFSPPALPDARVLIGYALAQLGCHRVFEDRASCARADRPGLADALSHLRRGDTLVVWRLDRLGRTTHQLVNLLEEFEREGIRLRSLQDGIDPSTIMSKALLQIAAVFADMERNLLRERTKAGLAVARARGRLGGRKPRLSAESLDTARRLMADPLLTMEEVASRLGVGRTTLYRALGRARAVPIAGTAAAERIGAARVPGRKPCVPALSGAGV